MIPEIRSRNGERRMFTVDDAHITARDAICGIAGPRQAGESVKAMLHRAAKLAGLSALRIKKLYYGEVSSPAWHEVETLRSKAKERREARARIRDTQVAAEIALIRARLERLERDGDASAFVGEDPPRHLEVESARLD